MQVFHSKKNEIKYLILTECFLIFSSLKSLRTNDYDLAQYMFLTSFDKTFTALFLFLKKFTKQYF